MNGGWLYRLDLDSEEVSKLSITVGDELPSTLSRWIDASENVAAATLSPDGKRAVFEARGDLYSVPAKNGATRNLTNTQGVRESSPEWSPDGRWIAYYSDASGEMDLFIRSHDGQGEPRRLAQGREMWLYPVLWSPDSKKLALGNSENGLEILEVDCGALTSVDVGRRGHLDTYRWSPDSQWVVYETTHPETELPTLAVYSLTSNTVSLLGDGTTFDYNPAFSQDGKFLFFQSDRDYNLNFSDFEFNYIYDDASRIYAAALEPGTEPLFPLESDEVQVDGEGEGNGEKKNGEENGDGEKKAPTVNVTPDGIANRTVALPGIDSGNYGQLTAVQGAVLYLKFPNGGPPALMRYDLKAKEEKEITKGVGQYVVGAKGEKVLYRQGSDWKIAAAKPGEKGEALDLSGLRMKLEPQAEWAQMFDEAWRVGRDWFYDSNMHGIDWQAMKTRYGALVPHISHRSDLDLIFGEMIGELEAGHAYGQRGDEHTVERVEGGMLGAELEVGEADRYRIAKIFPGENWSDTYRSPLTEHGVDVDEGDYLLAIDGVELTTAQNPYQLLEGKADSQVVLTINSSPSMSGAREETVRTIASERSLRYLDWIKSRAALVEELSGGRIGYIHLPNTAQEGNEALQKFFYSQVSKPGLIIDDRYNGGGFIPDRMIEMLSRTTLSYWARRGIGSMSTPGYRHDGPKAMLINGYAASGGDALPYYFRKEGLGTLIGTTTWGGLIGISGNPMLVDGGGVLYPRFRLYDTEGEWAVENVGVKPDIEIWDLSEAIAAGGDPSIEKAVEVLLEELEEYTGGPETPMPPNMVTD
jgi:tricorn protease